MQPQHTICDDYESNFSVEPPNDPNHLYCNDNMLKNHIITPETSQRIPSNNNSMSKPEFWPFLVYIHKVLNEPIGNGYVRQDKLARAVSGVANQSLDSALGSPAWPSYDRPSNKASCLGSFSVRYWHLSSGQRFQWIYRWWEASLLLLIVVSPPLSDVI